MESHEEEMETMIMGMMMMRIRLNQNQDKHCQGPDRQDRIIPDRILHLAQDVDEDGYQRLNQSNSKIHFLLMENQVKMLMPGG